MKYLYLLLDIFTVLVPLLFSFHPKIKFYKNWNAFFAAAFITSIIFIVWDEMYTRLGVWGFNQNYIIGVYCFHLPLEEIFFFLCIPYACVFTYHCLNSFYKINWRRSTVNIFTITLTITLLITGILFYNRIYTSVVFISLALILLLLNFYLKVNWLVKLLSIYPVLLIPFFIVNGILTGTGINAPIVWYNNAEIIGLRLLTIPVEDVFYGFELILINIFFYEYFKAKFQPIK